MPKDVKNSSEPVDETYYPHLKRSIILNLLFDDTEYPTVEAMDFRMKPFTAIDRNLGLYNPIMYASDFWVLRKHITELNLTSIHELVHGKNISDEVKEE